MSDNYTIETIYRIYDGNDGSYIQVQVSETAGGLSLIELNHKWCEGYKEGLPRMHTEQARLVAKAINDLCGILEQNGKSEIDKDNGFTLR
jgi:hypothetical protein